MARRCTATRSCRDVDGLVANHALPTHQRPQTVWPTSSSHDPAILCSPHNVVERAFLESAEDLGVVPLTVDDKARSTARSVSRHPSCCQPDRVDPVLGFRQPTAPPIVSRQAGLLAARPPVQLDQSDRNVVCRNDQRVEHLEPSCWQGTPSDRAESLRIPAVGQRQARAVDDHIRAGLPLPTARTLLPQSIRSAPPTQPAPERSRKRPATRRSGERRREPPTRRCKRSPKHPHRTSASASIPKFAPAELLEGPVLVRADPFHVAGTQRRDRKFPREVENRSMLRLQPGGILGRALSRLTWESGRSRWWRSRP